MDTERAKKILAESGIEHPAFAQRLGIKANSFRMNLSMGRLSKKAVALLLELEELALILMIGVIGILILLMER